MAAIFGAGGGLGHLAIQYAKLAGSIVVAVDIVESKLETANEAFQEVIEAKPKQPRLVFEM